MAQAQDLSWTPPPRCFQTIYKTEHNPASTGFSHSLLPLSDGCDLLNDEAGFIGPGYTWVPITDGYVMVEDAT